jgi:hypothetical protein
LVGKWMEGPRIERLAGCFRGKRFLPVSAQVNVNRKAVREYGVLPYHEGYFPVAMQPVKTIGTSGKRERDAG